MQILKVKNNKVSQVFDPSGLTAPLADRRGVFFVPGSGHKQYIIVKGLGAIIIRWVEGLVKPMAKVLPK